MSARGLWLIGGGILLAGASAYAQPAGDDAALADRLRRLEERSQQVEALTQRVRDMEAQVQSLQAQVRQYEAVAQSKTAASEAQRAELQRSVLEHASASGGYASGGGGGYGEGFELTVWGWLSYLYATGDDTNTFWAWEVELDITKSFSERLAASADIDFTDMRDGAEAEVEQAFLSYVASARHETLITFGKFNSPFGVEPRDFWDRLTGTESLLFAAQPQNLTGIMVTQPLGDTGVVLRPFLVNGFDDDRDVNKQPSFGLTAEYHPHRTLKLAATNWYGAEQRRDNAQQLYFLDLQAEWTPREDLTIAAEYLLGMNEDEGGDGEWQGFLVLASYELNDRWRVFGRWSYLDDPDGLITEIPQVGQEVSAGVGWRLHPQVELRGEYRHDFNDQGEDIDSVSAHATFGF